jgi:general secretion pathway protein A
MYNNYFKFSDSPFENNLDQRFLFFSANHKEVAASLLYFIKWKKGFALVCGDVGTGKTMLINYLLNKLPDSVHPIMIANPDVGYIEILRYVAGILKIDAKGKRVLDLVDHVKAALVEASLRGERFVLIIDEAHLLPDKSIEQIRLLSNIETQKQKLFQILLLGQYELSYKLDRPEMRQLRQRININRFLAPMDAAETIQYIDHRLRLAGASFDACFESDCRHLIFKMTNGVPRSINQLCDSALMVCMAEKRQKVSRKVLKRAAAALRSDILFTPRFHAGSTALSWKWIRPLAAFGAFAIILILLGLSGYWGGLGGRVQNFLHGLYSPILTPPVAVHQPVAETVAKPEIPPAAVKSGALNAAKLPDTEIETSSKIESRSTTRTPVENISNENRHQDQPKARVALLKESRSSSGIAKQPYGQQAPENIDHEKGPVAPLPEIQEATQPIAATLPGGRTGEVDGSPQSSGKDIRPENIFSILQNPKKIEVKNGNTLNEIASRFFPENKAEGIKKILSANPMIDNVDRIYTGQILIIPGNDLVGKDTN